MIFDTQWNIVKYQRGMIPFYPVKTERNQGLYERYVKLAKDYSNVIFAGRLGGFKYYDMDDTIANALELVKNL